MGEPELERQGRRLTPPGTWLVLVGAALIAPGVVLVALGHTWIAAIGIVLIVLGTSPSVAGLGVLLSALVAHWAARHRSFA